MAGEVQRGLTRSDCQQYDYSLAERALINIQGLPSHAWTRWTVHGIDIRRRHAAGAEDLLQSSRVRAGWRSQSSCFTNDECYRFGQYFREVSVHNTSNWHHTYHSRVHFCLCPLPLLAKHRWVKRYAWRSTTKVPRFVPCSSRTNANPVQ